MNTKTNNKTDESPMKMLIPFALVSIIVVGVGPWLLLPALNGQPLDSVPAAMLRGCQLFFFAPIAIVLAAAGFERRP